MVDLKQIQIACQNCRVSELCLPRGLDRDEIEQLNNIVNRRRPLERGDFLYRHGDPLDGLYAVRSGSMRSYLTSPDGTEQTVGFYLPGELVGLDGLQDELHTCATVALETSSVCQVPCAQLKQLCAKLPGLQRQMMRLVGKEVSSDHEALLLLGSRTAEERLATFLLSLSRRYRARGFSETDFNLSMSRHDIANYLGTAVETVSRQFASLQKQGVLRVNQRRVHISDLNRLRSMVEPCVNHRSYSSL